MTSTQLTAYANAHPVAATVLTVTALSALLAAFLIVRAAARTTARAITPRTQRAVAAGARVDRADLLTYLAASIATAVAGQGMWRFFRDVLHVEPFLRVGMFGFVELAVLTSAVRARRSMREHGSAGVDGAAVWALTSLSACLSAMDARSVPEAVFRLAAPLVAAWLWERGMHVERRRTTGRAGIHWAITPERIFVRLRLAEPSGRTTGEVDADRYLTALALATAKARALQDAGATGRRYQRAITRLDGAMRQAITHTALSTNPTQQQHLLAQLAALTGARTLLTVDTPAPWTTPELTAGLDREPVGAGSDREPVGAGSARPADLKRLREAVAAGQLPPVPTVKAVRTHLAIGAVHARTARAALLHDPAPPDGTAPNPTTSHLRKTTPYQPTKQLQDMPEDPFEEAISALTKKATQDTQQITDKNPFQKNEEPHTYATPLT